MCAAGVVSGLLSVLGLPFRLLSGLVGVSVSLPSATTTTAIAAAVGASHTCNFPPFLTTTYRPPITTTDPTTSPESYLSPRALEKQPDRDASAVIPPERPPETLPPSTFDYTSFFSTSRHPSASASAARYDPPDLTLAQPQAQPQRRSFLEALLVRQKKVIPPDNRSTASKVLYPINYVPRPTRVQVKPQPHHQRQNSSLDTRTGDVRTLLTLPEQRRSRQHSPTDPIVEHSPRLGPPAGDRTSIPLPSNQQRGNLPDDNPPSGVGLMIESEKSDTNGFKAPDRAHLSTSRFNPRDRDLEAQQTSVLGSSYGVNPLDQPLHPPRRITSHRSLSHAQSAGSLRSSAYVGANLNGHMPSQEDDARPYTEDNEGSVAEELAWGPSHPCFPHLNPHVPLDSREYTATRIIRIRRDWMVAGDLAPTFSNIYPEILDPLMQEQEFRYVIEHINQTLCVAFDPFSTWNWFDGFLGFMTGWIWEDLRPMGVKGQLKALEEWLIDWNHTVGARDGVKIMPLRRTAYLNIDIQIPDPQVTVVGDRDGESGRPPNTAPTETTAPRSATDKDKLQ